MSITEEKLFEAFGLEVPDEDGEGGRGQEVAAPAPEGADPDADTGERGQEVAAPASAEDDDVDNDADQDDGEPEEDQDIEEAQREVNEKAAERRRAEQQAAINKAIKAERARVESQMADFFRSAGLVNTLTNEPIASMEEFTEYQRAYKAEQLQRDLQAGRLTPEGLDMAIANNPTMQQAQEVLQQREAERLTEQAARVQAQADMELAEIQKLDPSIKSYDDILAMPTGPAFYGYVGRGSSFIDAFKLANMDALMARTAETTAAAATQQAMNNARSKDHLSRTKGRGAGAPTVTQAELTAARIFMPDATEAEISKYFEKYKGAE